MAKNNNKAEKAKKNINLTGAKGILELLVIASIGFMSFIVLTGLDDTMSKLLCVPALVWAVVKLIYKFAK